MKKLVLIILASVAASGCVSNKSTVVDMEVVNSKTYVDVTLNNCENISFILDTGASMSTISQRMFHILEIEDDLEIIGEIEGTVVGGGTVKAKICKLKSLTVGKWVIHNVNICVLERGDTLLLGHDILSKFSEVTFDFENKKLILIK